MRELHVAFLDVRSYRRCIQTTRSRRGLRNGPLLILGEGLTAMVEAKGAGQGHCGNDTE